MRRLVLILATALAAVAAQLPPADAGSGLRATTVVADFPTGELTVGQNAPITGVVTGSGRPVRVQVQTKSGWLTVASTKSNEDGTFKAPAPTFWAGTHEVRMFTPATDTYQKASSHEAVVKAKRTYSPRGGTAWNYITSAGKARWDPCTVIKYRVNPKRMPKGGLSDVHGAFKRISAASGLRFDYVGKTKYVPLSGNGRATSAMTVAWATPKLVPGLSGSTIGRGGAMWYSSTSGGWHQVVSGYAVLDSTWKGKSGFGTGKTRGALLLHELGHAIGLGHVNDSRQMMADRLSDKRAEYAMGDLRGFAAVGAANGCI
ncbi:hypothetical protein BH09ACT11_BH09ACT11_06490 [soil metagenome]